MTAFLRINGITVPVRTDSAALTQQDIGGKHTAVDGTPIFNRRTTKRRWAVRTTIRSSAEAMAWRDLVTGKGHVVSWDNNNHYSSKGLAPSAVTAGFTLSATQPKFGAFRAASSAVPANSASWPMFTATSPWTVIVYDTIDAGTTWHQYIVNSAGQKWLDGVRNDVTVTTFLSVSAGVVTLGLASVAHGFDDLVGFPQLMPTTWPTQINAFATAFSLLPRLTADGLFVEQNAKITVKGDVGDLKAFRGSIGTGGMTSDLQDFSFSLMEV